MTTHPRVQPAGVEPCSGQPSPTPGPIYDFFPANYGPQLGHVTPAPAAGLFSSVYLPPSYPSYYNLNPNHSHYLLPYPTQVVISPSINISFSLSPGPAPGQFQPAAEPGPEASVSAIPPRPVFFGTVPPSDRPGRSDEAKPVHCQCCRNRCSQRLCSDSRVQTPTLQLRDDQLSRLESPQLASELERTVLRCGPAKPVRAPRHLFACKKKRHKTRRLSELKSLVAQSHNVRYVAKKIRQFWGNPRLSPPMTFLRLGKEVYDLLDDWDHFISHDLSKTRVVAPSDCPPALP